MRPLQPFVLVTLLLVTVVSQAEPDPRLIASCESCHGPKGISASPTTPSIAGISAPVLSASLKQFKAKSHPCGTPDMCAAAAGLSDADITALADHYSKLPHAGIKQQTDPAKVAAGKPIAARNCEGCHSKGGSDPADDAGILAGQPLAWLQSTLKGFKAGTIPGQEKMMKEKLAHLSDADLEALAHYYASL